PLGGDWPRELAAVLKSLTGTSWQVTLSDESGEPSLLDQERIAEKRVRADVLADPNVRAVTDVFPDAEFETFSTKGRSHAGNALFRIHHADGAKRPERAAESAGDARQGRGRGRRRRRAGQDPRDRQGSDPRGRARRQTGASLGRDH